MSGHRIKREPVYKAQAWRWGPPGWYCCGRRLMAPATLQSGAQVHRCLHCGLVVAVAGGEVAEVIRPERPPHTTAPSEQLTWRI